MMQVSKPVSVIVICSVHLMEEVAIKLSNVITFSNHGEIVSIELTDATQILQLEKEYYVLKVLDKFFLLGENTNAVDKIVSGFFSLIASSYHTLIDADNNLRNIEFLFRKLTDTFPMRHDSIVLDFGCGIGLSVQIYQKLNLPFRLIGVEKSHMMAQLARKNGLKILEIDRIDDYSLDGIICSYSLHFLGSLEIFKKLWNKLKFGRALVGNFHKNINQNIIVDLVKHYGGEAIRLSEDASGSSWMFIKNSKPFISIESASAYYSEKFNIDVSKDVIKTLIAYYFIPTYFLNSKEFLLENDLDSFYPFLLSIQEMEWVNDQQDLYGDKILVVKTAIGQLSFKEIRERKLDAHLIAIFTNFLKQFSSFSSSSSVGLTKTFNGLITIDLKSSEAIGWFASAQSTLERIESKRASLFANSASYMGSKRSLKGFIIEALRPFINSKTIAVDLMCGSGVVAGSLSQICRTLASDAMSFCRILAKVQGGGYSLEMANYAINEIQPHFEKNLGSLQELFTQQINKEDEYFHSELTHSLRKNYAAFCKQFPSLNGHGIDNDLYAERNLKPKMFPYLLYTCSYSNLYLGIKQAIELDSLRYAIDQLSEPHKTWALGALISTLSALGNTYGGHFAQPKFKELESLSFNELFKLIEQRGLSFKTEFQVRLREFALESQTNESYPVETISGPWQIALNELPSIANQMESFVIYLDAPYTRDEYSRYYHVLETLSVYNYPPLSGTGRVPTKEDGLRFASEFFTKTPSKLKEVYKAVISAILSKGNHCAWSYSDNATIPIMEIIYEMESHGATVSSLVTPYVHNAQGGKKAKRIKEYLVIFSPTSN